MVLVALAACVIAEVQQDQEAAEQYYLTHGSYPSWYTYGAYPAATTGVRSVAYPYAYGTYPNVATVAATGIRNVAYPYATYGAGYAYGAYPTTYANAATYSGIYPNGHVAHSVPAYNYVY